MIKMLNEIETYVFFRLLATQIIFVILYVGVGLSCFISEYLLSKILFLIAMIGCMIMIFIIESQIRKIRNKLK